MLGYQLCLSLYPFPGSSPGTTLVLIALDNHVLIYIILRLIPFSPEPLPDGAVDEDVDGGVDDEEEVGDGDGAHEPGRGAEAGHAASHQLGHHEELVKVQHHPICGHDEKKTSVRGSGTTLKITRPLSRKHVACSPGT